MKEKGKRAHNTDRHYSPQVHVKDFIMIADEGEKGGKKQHHLA